MQTRDIAFLNYSCVEEEKFVEERKQAFYVTHPLRENFQNGWQSLTLAASIEPTTVFDDLKVTWRYIGYTNTPGN
jgi:hypothetical protein